MVSLSTQSSRLSLSLSLGLLWIEEAGERQGEEKGRKGKKRKRKGWAMWDLSLPFISDRLIHMPLHNLGDDAWVSELIDHDANWWNVDRVESLFPRDIDALICGLAITPRTQHDSLIWSGTKNGLYSVRSGYHLELEQRSWSQGNCSTISDHGEVWKSI